jgi:hypothetical protein
MELVWSQVLWQNQTAPQGAIGICHTKRHTQKAPDLALELGIELELELELIQARMTQKQLLWVEVGLCGLRLSPPAIPV